MGNKIHEINLPPLPAGYALEVAAAMRNYARAAVEHFLNQSGQYITNDASRQAAIDEAIEAERKRQGEVVVTKTPEGEIIAVTRQDDEGKILSVIVEADRKRRGEPESNLLTKFFAALDQATALDSKQSQWSNKTVGSHHERVIAWAEVHRLRGLLAPQPAAPAPGEPCFAIYRKRLDENGGKEYFHAALYHNQTKLSEGERMVRGAFIPSEPQTAPAQEPSDDDLHNLWSRSGGVMRTFARALLARYGSKT